MKHLSFWIWVFSLNTILCIPIHLVANAMMFFVFIAEEYSFGPHFSISIHQLSTFSIFFKKSKEHKVEWVGRWRSTWEELEEKKIMNNIYFIKIWKLIFKLGKKRFSFEIYLSYISPFKMSEHEPACEPTFSHMYYELMLLFLMNKIFGS